MWSFCFRPEKSNGRCFPGKGNFGGRFCPGYSGCFPGEAGIPTHGRQYAANRRLKSGSTSQFHPSSRSFVLGNIGHQADARSLSTPHNDFRYSYLTSRIGVKKESWRRPEPKQSQHIVPLVIPTSVSKSGPRCLTSSLAPSVKRSLRLWVYHQLSSNGPKKASRKTLIPTSMITIGGEIDRSPR